MHMMPNEYTSMAKEYSPEETSGAVYTRVPTAFVVF